MSTRVGSGVGGSLTDREIGQVGRGGRLVFASPVQATAVLPAVAASISLPSVEIPSVPAGITINRVIAGMAWRKQVNSSLLVNAVDGEQQIQVRNDTPGTFRDAITIADNSLETAASATEGGVMLLGDSDISVELDGVDIYEFQWQNALVDGASLTLHDVQTYLIVEYTIGQQAPQGSAVNGSNPPALTPTGGAKDYLWITAHGYNNTDLTTAPANYGNTLEARLTTGSCFSARRNLNASSEDPGAWGAVGATAPVAVTVAVHPPPITCDLSGTVTDDNEEDIRAGGSTIFLTLNDGTRAAGGSSFDNQRQGIIDGLDSDGSEDNGWNAVVQPAIPVGNVVRTSDTVVTITLPAVATYFIDDQETITATIPASAVQEAVDPIVAVPTFTITNAPTGAFPQVEATAQSTQLDGADRTLDLPSGIEGGNLLLLLLWIGNTTSVIDNPTGWTQIQNVPLARTGSNHRWRVFYRQADGGEGPTLAIHISSGSTTVDTKSIVYRISGHRDPSVRPPQSSTPNESPVGLQTNSPDPSSLSPSGGAKDYLWLAFASIGTASGTEFSGFPTNYTNALVEGPAGGPVDENIGVAQRELFNATEDPGAFTLVSTEDWLAGTIAIPPDFVVPLEAAFGLPGVQKALLLL